ncbi:N-6 DNA methylase [Planobispora takensis]|nr:N-6 DNA methylase [Planobispora takensis]
MWSYCDVLRDAGVSAIDYVEQLTYLLFLKMADERAKLPAALGGERILPEGISWDALKRLSGDRLENTYRHFLAEPAEEEGTLGVVFRKAQNKVQDPSLLKKLIVDLMDNGTWGRQGTDIKGDAYEQLLARSTTDIKSGAGQYFTPRALITAMVDCMRPTPEDTVIDPACGTGGFLLAANDYVREHHKSLTPGQRRRLTHGEAFRGVELVDGTARRPATTSPMTGRTSGRPPPTSSSTSSSTSPGGRRLEQLKVGAFDVGDIYRAAWVQAVAALDHWVHQEIYSRAVQLAQQPGVERPDRFNRLQIPMELFERIHHHQASLGEAFREHLEATLGYVSYQNPDKIQQGFSHVGNVKLWQKVAKILTEQRADGQQITGETVVQKLKAIAARRNKIAHESDRDPSTPTGRRAITAAEVTDTITWLEMIAAAILVALGDT